MSSSLMAAINAADQIAALFWLKQVCAFVVLERLAGLGFYDIDVDENDERRRCAATLNGIRYQLGRL